jgi:para-aminobenzoate synthetase component 2
MSPRTCRPPELPDRRGSRKPVAADLAVTSTAGQQRALDQADRIHVGANVYAHRFDGQWKAVGDSTSGSESADRDVRSEPAGVSLESGRDHCVLDGGTGPLEGRRRGADPEDARLSRVGKTAGSVETQVERRHRLGRPAQAGVEPADPSPGDRPEKPERQVNLIVTDPADGRLAGPKFAGTPDDRFTDVRRKPDRHEKSRGFGHTAPAGGQSLPFRCHRTVPGGSVGHLVNGGILILLIDNYDSFVFNLARYFCELGETVRVARNDEISIDEIRDSTPTHIVLSPGPCTPAEAGISLDVLREMADHIPVLGVCLGHQCIAAAFGGRLERAARPKHGVVDRVDHQRTGLFAGLPSPLAVTRYHSLVVPEESCGEGVVVTARSADGEVMAVAHTALPVWGVQFHPEAVLTFGGHRLLANFLALGRGEPSAGVTIEARSCLEIHDRSQLSADAR